MLQEQYPNENASETLRRLVKMWDLHVQSLNFGMRCKASCNCEAGWIRVFRRGDVYGTTKKAGLKGRRQLEPEEKNAIPRKRSRGETDSLPEIGGANADCSTGAPPAKKADTGGEKSQPFSLRTPRLQAVAAGRSIAPVRAPPTAHAANRSVYRVVYDANQPLGFYCETRIVGGKRVCIVTSVCPSGQSRQKSPLIHEGTWSKSRKARPRPCISSGSTALTFFFFPFPFFVFQLRMLKSCREPGW